MLAPHFSCKQSSVHNNSTKEYLWPEKRLQRSTSGNRSHKAQDVVREVRQFRKAVSVNSTRKLVETKRIYAVIYIDELYILLIYIFTVVFLLKDFHRHFAFTIYNIHAFKVFFTVLRG